MNMITPLTIVKISVLHTLSWVGYILKYIYIYKKKINEGINKYINKYIHKDDLLLLLIFHDLFIKKQAVIFVNCS